MTQYWESALTTTIKYFTSAVLLTLSTANMAHAESTVENLITQGQWKLASREILAEERAIDKHELSLPLAQLNAGYLDEALTTISGFHQVSKAEALLSIVENSETMKMADKLKIIGQALVAARGIRGISASYLKSGDLANIALCYSTNEQLDDTRVIFEEALRAADMGLREEGAGGYQRITQALLKKPTALRDWMLPLIEARLKREQQNENTTLAYRDLAKLSLALNKAQHAITMIESGFVSAKSIKKAHQKNSILESLDELAIDAGYERRIPKKSIYTLALSASRSGHPDKAIELLSPLPKNLYVDYGQVAYKRVFDDVIKRDDLKAALFFAEHPVRPIAWSHSSVWKQVGDLQIRHQQLVAAKTSYINALGVIANSREHERYYEDISSQLNVGFAMLENGFKEQGFNAILATLPMLGHINQRRVSDRIKATSLVAGALWKIGLEKEATGTLLKSYQLVSSYTPEGNWGKAELLVDCAITLTSFEKEKSIQKQ